MLSYGSAPDSNCLRSRVSVRIWSRVRRPVRGRCCCCLQPFIAMTSQRRHDTLNTCEAPLDYQNCGYDCCVDLKEFGTVILGWSRSR